MALTKSIYPAVLSTGLDTGTEPKLVSKGLLRLENARITRKGAISKRPGTVVLPDALPYDGYMTTYKESPVIFNQTMKVFDVTDGYFDTADKVPVFDVELNKIQTIGDSIVFNQTVSEYGKIRVVMWVGTDKLGALSYYIRTFDIVTGLSLDGPHIFGAVATISLLQTIATDTNILYFYVGNDFKIRIGSVDVNTGIVGAPGVLNNALPIVSISAIFEKIDTCLINTLAGDYIGISYICGVGAYNGYACFVTTQPNGIYDGYDVVNIDGYVANCFSWGREAGLVYYDGAGGQNIKMKCYNEHAVASTNEIVVYNWADTNEYPSSMSGVAIDNTNATIYTNITNDNFSYPSWTGYTRIATITKAGAVIALGSETYFLEGMACVAKPFADTDGYSYVVIHPVVGTNDLPQSTNFVARNDRLIVGKFMETEAFASVPSAIISAGTNRWRTSLVSQYYNETMGITIADMTTFVERKYRRGLETLEHLTLSGSIPMVWDGQKLVEQGFNLYPHRIVATRVAGATSIEVGTYGYCLTYEWYDALGNREESAPSLVFSLDCHTGDTVTVKCPTYTITEKGSTDVNAVLYRTDAYGSAYYRAYSQYNPQFSSEITFTDTLSNTSLLARDGLYTDGGVLENVSPPPSRISCVHQNRLFYVHRNYESQQIFYSKEFVKNYGLIHSDALMITCPFDGGAITAIHSFQDRLVIFKKDRIYTTYGEGLDELGTGKGYAIPSLLYLSLGCDNQKSVVEVPAGLIFQASDSRLYLLNRSFSVTPLDAPDYWTKNQEIVGSYVEPNNNEAVWMTDGYAIVYNWDFDMWATWSNREAVDCCVANEIPYWTTRSHNIKHSGGYLDDDYGPSTIVETGWFSFNQLEGFQRVKRILVLGTQASTHTLRVKIAYDFDPYWVDNFTYDAYNSLPVYGYEEYFGANLDPATIDKAYMVEVSGSRQKCTSIRLHISDEKTKGKGFELSAIAFEVGSKTGVMKLGTDRTKP
jgi:hypothetical protein